MKPSRVDRSDTMKRIPIYVCGFNYHEVNERFVCEGKRYLIDEKTEIALRDGTWKDEEEMNGIKLYKLSND